MCHVVKVFPVENPPHCRFFLFFNKLK
uniref:Uncharacterized protein n=1 Tax=Anguilla anguilla TaxID=7936 RepID=A0A0E9VAY6_ANGAN